MEQLSQYHVLYAPTLDIFLFFHSLFVYFILLLLLFYKGRRESKANIGKFVLWEDSL